MTLHLLVPKTSPSGVALAELIRVLMTYLEEVAYLRRTGQLEKQRKSEPSCATTGRLWKN